MLTGKRAFDAEDVSDTLALVLKGEPDWGELPDNVPKSIRALIHACLEKDRRQRTGDIASALFVLRHQADLAPTVIGPAAQPTQVSRASLWRRLAIAVGLMLAMAAVGVGVWVATRSDGPVVTRFLVLPPENVTFMTGERPAASAVISPDGKMLAFTARDGAGKVMLWVRQIASLTAQPLVGTEGAQFPFWSPDSRFIAFFTTGKLLKIAASGGPSQTLCAVNAGRGGTWSREGQIVYGENGAQGGGLFRVSSAGGQPSAFMQRSKGPADRRFPSFLPDARHVLYFTLEPSGGAIYVASVDTGETRRVVEAESGAVYDSRSGSLLFARQGTLLAQSFDPKTFALADEPVPVAELVESAAFSGLVAFSVSDNGVLAYGRGVAPSNAGLQPVWVDRQGKTIGTAGPTGNYRGVELAPDGKRMAAHRHDGQGGDVWTTDLSRGTTSRFTFDAMQDNGAPIWSPDGSRIAFTSIRNGTVGLYARPSSGGGGEERLLEAQVLTLPMSWSPDGRSIIYMSLDPKTNRDLWVLPLAGDRRPVPLVVTPLLESLAEISPDGKWFAYQSTESGQTEIYVRAFHGGEGKWQISTDGGWFPRWRGDGRELFYMDTTNNGKLIAAEIRSGGSVIEAGTPRALFDTGYFNLGPFPYHPYAVSADGQRFLIPRPVSRLGQDQVPPIAVVLNWAQAIQH